MMHEFFMKEHKSDFHIQNLCCKAWREEVRELWKLDKIPDGDVPNAFHSDPHHGPNLYQAACMPKVDLWVKVQRIRCNAFSPDLCRPAATQNSSVGRPAGGSGCSKTQLHHVIALLVAEIEPVSTTV